MHLAWCTDTRHHYDMHQPRQILFDPVMTMSMRIIHEHEKVQEARQRISITWSKANMNQITNTSKLTQNFGGHLQTIPSSTMRNYTIYGATSLQTCLSRQCHSMLPETPTSVAWWPGFIEQSAVITCPQNLISPNGKWTSCPVFWMNKASYEAPWPEACCL